MNGMFVHVHSKKLCAIGMNGMFVHVHSKKLCTLGMNGDVCTCAQ